MKTDDLRRYFDIIQEETRGDNTSDSEIIDYENGYSISIKDIENEYHEYLELQEEIDDYTEENDLDDVIDKEKIINHFSNKIDEKYFKLNQAVLEDFTNYMRIKIEDGIEEKTKEDIENIKNIIEDFAFTEYGEDTLIDFSNLKKVDLAYTTTEDSEHEIQVSANLIDLELITSVDGKVVETIKYKSLDEMKREIENTTFDDLVSIDLEESEEEI